MSATSTPNAEQRAKRTHARRSCDVCKLRKTRCELPDLDIPSSSFPLPADKACHRCKILAIPCIVDDSARKIRKKPRDDIDGGLSRPNRPRTSRTTTAGNATNPGNGQSGGNDLGQATIAALALAGSMKGIDHTLDIMHGLNPSQVSPTFALPEGNASNNANVAADGHGNGNSSGTGTVNGAGNADVSAGSSRMPPFGSREPSDSFQAKAIRLHGRPLELVCAMLRVAYGKKGLKRAGVAEGYDVDLNSLVDEHMRQRLEPGVAKLRALHPYLEPLPYLFTNYNQSSYSPSSPDALLLSLVIYLSTLCLNPADDLAHIRRVLTPLIITLRDELLLHLPQCFVAIQALCLLTIHAPLGVLPAQLVNPRTLAVARGQLAAAQAISSALNSHLLIRQLVGISRLGSHMAWETTDMWLWLDLCAIEASLALEDEAIKKPANMPQARDIVESFLSNDYREVWSTAMGGLAGPELVGRLAICDRVIRLAEVLDSMIRIRNGLETAATDPTYDIVGSTVEEMKYLTERLDNIDTRHDAILGAISHLTQGIESGWLAYRALRRRYETNKVYVAGCRTFMATAYLPGHPLAFTGLPSGLQAVQKVTYAMSRAQNPPDIMTFIMAQATPATQATWTWGKHRGEICESTLVAFEETGRTLIDPHQPEGNRLFVPLHDIMCIAVESTKVLMEMQAGSIVMERSSKRLQSPFRIPTWVYLVRQVADILRTIGSYTTVEEGEDGVGKGQELDGGGEKLESIANGCANLVGSMCRLADQWDRTPEKEEEMGAQVPMGDGAADQQHYQQQQQHQQQQNGAPGITDDAQNYQNQNTLQDYDTVTMGSSVQSQNIATPAPPPAPGNGSVPHHPYMDTSDRWMASDHHPYEGGGHPPGGSAVGTDHHGYAGPQHGGEDGQPTPLDLLLSHMFNYNYHSPAAAPHHTAIHAQDLSTSNSGQQLHEQSHPPPYSHIQHDQQGHMQHPQHTQHTQHSQHHGPVMDHHNGAMSLSEVGWPPQAPQHSQHSQQQQIPPTLPVDLQHGCTGHQVGI